MQSPSKRMLVLDTWILGCLAERSPNAQFGEALELLGKILCNCHSITLDHEGKVLQEYRPYLDREKFLQKWFRQMGGKGKIKYRPLHDFPLSGYISEDDKKFLSLAASTCDRIVISGDPDLTSRKTDDDVLSHGICVLGLKEGCERL